MIDRARAELRHALEEGGPARADAEFALGNGPVEQRLRSAILALATRRGPQRTICPSDAARAVGGKSWRALTGDARELARELAKSGAVQITQRGEVLDADGPWRGPIRIGITGN
ncbi:DUF3253 domain-containing protein [Mycobacterium vicinigordonae]|uniref:DUF3253 domain-containing protein n=1 Tax=Mycobacterium vicinigordonae TaxID=1719132 RepID=UPI001FE36C17|nr:DUF3253 domain-containing protein [Mycobacterium vicinigordonae]